jgi:endonuclease/exonuclease/phosphatase family metal-dependent hydrolase
MITTPTLKLMSLNLAHGRKGRLNQVLLSRDTIRRNLEEIGSVLRSHGADIVALQESDGPSMWSGGFDHVQYLAGHGRYLHYVHTSHSSSKFFTSGTAFLSKVPLQEVGSKTFGPSPPTLNKGFTRVTVLWKPEDGLSQPLEVDLVSVHLDFSRGTVRGKQAAELISEFAPHRGPLIILGDLNADWVGKDTTVRDIAHNLSLTVFQPHSTELGTYASTRRRLDWILISDELRFGGYGVLPDVLSDHLAVSAELRPK